MIGKTTPPAMIEPDERRVGQPARAMAGEKADEALVVARDAVDVEQHLRHDQAERRSRYRR